MGLILMLRRQNVPNRWFVGNKTIREVLAVAHIGCSRATHKGRRKLGCSSGSDQEGQGELIHCMQTGYEGGYGEGCVTRG